MTDAILYTRVSTDKQDMLRQDYALPGYCLENKLNIVGRHSDPDTSGSIPMEKRAGGRAMLEELRQRAARGSVVLVASDQDRIGRDLVDIVNTIRAVWQCGSMPHFALEGGPLPRTPENEMALGVKATTAQYMRDKIRQNITGKMKQKRAAGELLGGIVPPYGFDAELTGANSVKGVPLKRLVPNLTEQQWLLQIWQWRNVEKLSFNRIVRELNNRGVTTKRGAGHLVKWRGQHHITDGKWCAATVRNLLLSQTTLDFISSQRSEAGSQIAA